MHVSQTAGLHAHHGMKMSDHCMSLINCQKM